ADPLAVAEPPASSNNSPAAGNDTSTTESPAETPAAEPGEDAATATSADSQLVGVRGAAPISAQQLATALVEVNKASDAWDEFTGDDKGKQRDLGLRFYRSLAQLGQSTVFVDPQDPETPKRVDAMMRRLNGLAQDSKKMALVRAVSRIWLTPGQRDNDGVAIVGDVKSIRQTGVWHEVQIEANGATLDFVTANDPADAFGEGDRLLIIGSLVSEPTANLASYEGEAELVGIIGMPVKLPSE
ncbi:MAG: hypothetical protein KDA47_10015, partial [Planctomycetales bacterium]|nr:hypothetical protein [Planctomycetales bacterium]